MSGFYESNLSRRNIFGIYQYEVMYKAMSLNATTNKPEGDQDGIRRSKLIPGALHGLDFGR